MAYITNEIKTVEGTSISINDSDQKIFDTIELNGNTYQKTTTGKNLLGNVILTPTKSNGITITPNFDGSGLLQSYKINGTNTSSSAIFIALGIYLGKNSTSYKINGISDYTNLKLRVWKGTSYTDVNSNETTITTAAEGTSFGVQLRIAPGGSFTNYVITPMVRLSSISDSTYEPYTGGIASPNPDYPQNVDTVTGRQEIDVVGKNLFNLRSISMSTGTATLDNGEITLSWTVGFNLDLQNVVSNLINGEQYTISFKHKGDALYLRNKQVDRNTNILATNTDSDYTTYSLTLNNISAFEFRFVRKDTTGTAYIKDIQIEQGSTPTTYEPYKEQSYEINLGKNLFDKDNIQNIVKQNNSSYTILNNGIRVITTRNSGYCDIFIVLGLVSELQGKTQTISYNVAKGGSGNNSIRTTMWTLKSDYSTSRSLFNNTNDGHQEITYTVPNATENDVYLGLLLYSNNGSTTSLTGDYVDYTDIQIEEGSQATSYSPYKTPIELCKIGDYQDFIRKGTGKNLFDGVLELGTYSDVGIKSGSSANYRNSTPIQVQPNTTYTFSINGVSQKYAVYYYNNTNTFISSEGLTTGTFTTPANCYYINFRCFNADWTSNYANLKVQIEEGSQATLYEPYGFKDKWYSYKAIGKVVLDGSDDEGWGYSSSNVLFVSDVIRNVAEHNNEMSCSHFTIVPISTSYANMPNGTIRQDNNSSRLIVKYTDYTTATAFKTWLSTHNTILYYVLATPTTTEITDSELIKQLEYIELLEGINNISVSSNDLSSPLKLSYYSTNNPYYDVIYSQDDKNDLKIKFNGVELADASLKCETIKRTARILPDDGSKRFSLDNFISTSLEVVLHNVNVEDMKDQVEIEIGTLIDSTNNTYQYIPLGIFNIQDTPENNNGKVTLKLRDNRVKFDFNYNAKTFIDNNYVLTTDTTYQESITYYTYNQSSNEYTQLVKGTDYNVGDTISGNIYIKLNTLTKGQMLNDICSQANVVNTIVRFNGDEDSVGIYDNTIQATTYVSYLMEQAGLIPVIDRLGRLKAVELDKLYVWRIPLSILEGYEKGEPYKIERAVYESGVIKYETSSDKTLDTLYIDAANPYISNNAQVDYVLNKLQNFEIDSVKTKKVLGNPAIDPYDLIQVYNDLDGTNDVVFTTLANTSYTFNGVHRDNFSTEIGQEERTENVSINGESTFQKWAKTEINNVNSTITIQAGEIETINGTLEDTYTKGQVDTLVQTAQTGLTNTFSEAGGNNIFRNTGLWFESGDNNNPYEFWSGVVVKTKEEKAANMNALKLQLGSLSQNQIVSSGTYTVSFKYKKLSNLSDVVAKVIINDNEYILNQLTDTEFVTGQKDSEGNYITQPLVVGDNKNIKVEFVTNLNDSCEIYDLMVNAGEVKLAYSQNQNETTTDTVNISKGITITSSDLDVTFKANADGIRTLDKSNNELTKFTDTGMTTKEAIIENTSRIVGLQYQEVNGQTWITRL